VILVLREDINEYCVHRAVEDYFIDLEGRFDPLFCDSEYDSKTPKFRKKLQTVLRKDIEKCRTARAMENYCNGGGIKSES
jgi:hypothetical protein